jgi:hypothetical protein
MKGELLILFVILLLGLILCSFLGGKGCTEGMENNTSGQTFSGPKGSSAQITQPITLNTQDANGNQATKILTPVIDPYQQQSGVIELKQPFRIDGFTKLTFSIYAASSVQFQFYPSDTINIARGLGGNAVSKQYGSPKIIRPASR